MQSDKARDEAIVSARENGFTYRRIAQAWGISPQRAHQIYKRLTK